MRSINIIKTMCDNYFNLKSLTFVITSEYSKNVLNLKKSFYDNPSTVLNILRFSSSQQSNPSPCTIMNSK